MRLHRALTTVELLVVCAILTILAAIITVATISTKANVRNTACLSNMKQIGLAVTLYAADNDRLAPPYLTHARGIFGTSRYIPARPQAWRDSLFPYGRSIEIFYCPRDRIRGRDPTRFGAWDSTVTSYRTFGVAFEQDVFGPNGSFRLNYDVAAQAAAEQPKGQEVNPYLGDLFYPGPHGKEVTLHGDTTTLLWPPAKVVMAKVHD